MGSKSRIAKDIVPIIQDYIDEAGVENYCEPFCGGCNIIDKIRCTRKLACDLNQYLIALLIHVRDGGELYDSVSRELYNKAKAAFKSGHTSEFRSWQIGNIGFLASFNGKFFDGGYAKAGYEKTRYRDYYREAKDNLLKQAPKLKGIDFMVSDYKNINLSGSKYVIYADPPYCGTTKYANATEFNYDEFWDKMREWAKDNIVLVSEENAPGDWRCIWQKDVSRSLSATNKSVSVEKLFIKGD